MNYTFREVSKRLKVSKTHIYTLVRKGEISKIPNLGMSVRIPQEEMKRLENDYLAKQHRSEGDVSMKTSEENAGVKIFGNSEFGQVRWVKIEGKPYAVGADIAKSLGYINPTRAVKDHCDGGVTYTIIDKLGREQQAKVIPEADIYRLVVKAVEQTRNREIQEHAKKFEKWIFEEILPRINHTGGYVQKGREEEFTNNYFKSLSPQTKKMIVDDIKARNEQLENEKLKFDREIESNNQVLIQLHKAGDTK